jgi:hypothetical protein
VCVPKIRFCNIADERPRFSAAKGGHQSSPSDVVQSTDPTSLIRVVLIGSRAVSTSAAPTAPAMPAFGWNLNDTEIADVLTYVRNTWGNAASAVQPEGCQQAAGATATVGDRLTAILSEQR